MREVEKTVLEALQGRDKDHPLTRSELRQIVGTRDSAARGVIQSLRYQGYRIVGTASAKGYWFAQDESEFKAFLREYTKKGYTIIEIGRRMEGYTEGQQVIDGI